MMSIATAACAFCVTQSANAAETSSTTGVNTTVNSSANNSSDTGSNTAGSSSVTSSNATSNTTNGGSAFAKGSAKQVKTAESKNTAESAKQSKHKNTAESAQSSKPQQPANSEKDTKNSKSNVESTGKAKYSAATGNLNKSNSHAESSTNQTVLKAASGNSSATAAKPVYDTADNYTKVSEDDGSISYNYVNNSQKITNPFPDIISDNDIEKAFKNKEVSVEKIYFKPAATSDNPDPKNELVKNRFLKNVDGEYIVYKVYKNFPDDNSAQIYSNFGISIKGSIAKDGSIYAGSKSTVTFSYEPFTFELNGYKIAENSKKSIDIKCIDSSFKNYLYLKLTYKYKFNSERFNFLHNYCHQGECDNYSWFFNRYFSAADAQFHFVDDLQYRAMNPNGVDKDGKLKQRGNSDTHPSLTDKDKQEGTLISAIPLHEIDGLHDIHGTTVVTTDEASFYRNDSGDLKTPILSYTGDPKATDTNRPTLAQLTTGKNIPGYVYWDNDIDKPQNKNHEFANDDATKNKPGNHYLSFAYEMKDGKPVKRLTRKHYYVTFRAIPTQLVVKYKKSDGTFESDAKYELLGSGNAQIGNEFAATSTDATTSSKEALVNMMKSAGTTFLKGTTGYLSNGAVYLLPGNYTVKPNIKAPDGYEWVVETGKSSNSSADISIGLQTGDAAVAKSVTFVLRKKPTPPTPPMPPTPPAPAPTPEPEPEPAPAPTPTPEPEPEPEPTPTPEPDIDWDDIPDIDLTPDQEPEPNPVPVPDFPVPVAPAPILPPAEAEPEPAPAPAPSQPEQPEQQAKHVVKHLPKTGSTATTILASAIASLFAGLAGLAESFSSTRKRRN